MTPRLCGAQYLGEYRIPLALKGRQAGVLSFLE